MSSVFLKNIERQYTLKKPSDISDYPQKSIKIIFSILKESRYIKMGATDVSFSPADRKLINKI